ncbi:MAG TPA: hypothetical protein DHV96_05165 [Lachnospiraceae bacterium]|nr:hypothetical protein [Lachnospiraceae bacterium]
MIYITFGVFLLLLLRSVFRKYWFVSSYLVAVYAVMMFFAIRLSLTSYSYYPYSSHDSLLIGGLLTLLLVSCILPFFREKPVIIHDESEEFLNKFFTIGSILSVVLIIGMILLAPYVVQTAAYGLVNARAAMYLGESVITSYSLTGHIGHSILRWFGWLGYLNLIFFFYSLIYIRRNILFKIGLLISSFGSVWIGILNGGRTYVVYWLLFFLFCLAAFYKEFTFKRKRQVFIVLIIALIIVFRYFAFVTAGRVENSSWFTSSEEFLVNYAGQPYTTFIHYFENCTWHPYNFKRLLPLTTTAIFGRFNLTEYRSEIMSHNGVNVNGFSTFLGDIYVDIGLIGLLIYVFIFVLTVKKVMSCQKFDLARMIYLGIVIQIPLFGVFYYSFYRIETIVSIIVALLIANYLNPKSRVVRFKLGNHTLFNRRN